MTITITEALAEIKTIGKRIEKKRAGIMPYLARQDGVKDPLDKDGGSEKFIREERQSIDDLGARVIKLRRGIQLANERTPVTIGGVTRTVADWLIWRRDVAPSHGAFLNQLRANLGQVRAQAQKSGVGVAVPGSQPSNPADFVVNISETDLSAEIDLHETTLGELDGQLSLKNATVMIAED